MRFENSSVPCRVQRGHGVVIRLFAVLISLLVSFQGLHHWPGPVQVLPNFTHLATVGAMSYTLYTQSFNDMLPKLALVVQVCDHAKWASALGLQRIIHKLEANSQQGTECAPALLATSVSVTWALSWCLLCTYFFADCVTLPCCKQLLKCVLAWHQAVHSPQRSVFSQTSGCMDVYLFWGMLHTRG